VSHEGNGRYTILLRRLGHHSSTPLRGYQLPDMVPSVGLGAAPSGPALLTTGAGVATGVATSVGAFASLGAAAGPIAAGIGALVGIIAGLWSAHDARVKGATTENAAVQSGLTAFDASLKAIFAAANAGQITAAQASQTCQQILQNFWSSLCPFTTGAGRADASMCGSNCGTLKSPPVCGEMASGGHLCNKSCTVTCCVGCNDLTNTIALAMGVLASPTGGSFTTCTVYSSSFGLAQDSGYQLSYTPPAPGSVAGIASAVSSGSVAGVPAWALIAAVMVGVYAFTR